MEKERVLFSLIKDGNRKGARKVLNEILGAIFYRSPKLLTLRGRAIELLGHLARTAIAGNPLLEPLLEQDTRWMEQLIEAPDFEAVCMVLNQAIDDFIDQIYLQSRDRSNQKVANILDFINRNYSTKISLPMLAAEAGLSTFRTAHLVKEVTGKTVTQNIQEARINKAKELLQTTVKSCTEIAYEVGYGEQSYFIKHFKRLVGVTPTRYRRT
jgi:AraC-like DNA-binding protein